jgi:hypothetical protein
MGSKSKNYTNHHIKQKTMVTYYQFRQVYACITTDKLFIVLPGLPFKAAPVEGNEEAVEQLKGATVITKELFEEQLKDVKCMQDVVIKIAYLVCMRLEEHLQNQINPN